MYSAPSLFPTIPQQCHEVLFWKSFRQTCPSSVKQTTTKTIIANRLVDSRFRWSVWWCVPKCRAKWCVLCILEEKLNSVQFPTTVTVDTRFAISNLNCLPCFPLNDILFKRKNTDTLWGEHVLCYHGDMDLTKGKTLIFTARVLAFEENIIQRKAREAVEIRDRKPGINRNGGWKLDWVQFLF